MIQITARGNSAQCTRTERITSGMVGLQCEFVFDSAWDGLARTAVFIAGNEQRDVLLTGDTCTIPWEVLKAAGYQLYIGVYGTNADGTLVIPTVYANCGGIAAGADPSGDEGEDPTPTLVEQIMAAAGAAVTTANEVKAAADAGEFKGKDGYTPVKGIDYFDGAAAKINGRNTLNIVAGENVNINQDESTMTISATGGGGEEGTSDHSKLANRDADKQHPISAIEGLQTALNGKQPSIADLDTIRSGAAKGSTAVQPDDLPDYPETDQAQEVAIDTEPVENSTNLITSGAVYDAVQGRGGGATVNTYTLSEPVASIEFDLNGADEASIAFEVPQVSQGLTYGYLMVNGNQSGFFTLNAGLTSGKAHSFLSVKRISSGRWFLMCKKGNGEVYESLKINSSATVPIVGGVIELEITSFGYKCYGADALPAGTVITEIVGGRL